MMVVLGYSCGRLLMASGFISPMSLLSTHMQEDTLGKVLVCESGLKKMICMAFIAICNVYILIILVIKDTNGSKSTYTQ